MIFVGDGALLWRAVRHVRAQGHQVDLVCTPGRTEPEPGVPVRTVGDRAGLAAAGPEITAACSDGLVWSLDNPLLFGPELLGGDLTVLNVHGGALPAYRGLPVACVAWAILQGETEFAATLHRVDAGVDTGPVIAERRFPIAPDDVFEDVMAELVEACHGLFTDHLDDAVAGRLTGRPQPEGPGGYYGSRAVAELARHRDHPEYERATELGVYADFFPAAAAAW